MRIRVTKTTRAAPDGVTVRSYRAGETAEMPEDLARVFLREGWGRAVEAAPANKALDGAPENKTPPNPRRTKRRRRRRKQAPAGR
jgi:hypothetical protein